MSQNGRARHGGRGVGVFSGWRDPSMRHGEGS
jgi:hypothetical protein